MWLGGLFEETCKRAHTFTRGQTAWRPPRIVGPCGRPLVHPPEVAQAIADDWRRIWTSPTAGSEDSLIRELRRPSPKGPRLPRLTPDQLRRASASLSRATSASADGLHPRHFSWLSDTLLDC